MKCSTWCLLNLVRASVHLKELKEANSKPAKIISNFWYFILVRATLASSDNMNHTLQQDGTNYYLATTKTGKISLQVGSNSAILAKNPFNWSPKWFLVLNLGLRIQYSVGTCESNKYGKKNKIKSIQFSLCKRWPKGKLLDNVNTFSSA